MCEACVTGDLFMLDSDGAVAPAYQVGDDVRLRVEDRDVNVDSTAIETVQVRVTSDTENTGEPFTASAPAPGGANVGDGALSILEVGFSAQTEDWTLTAIDSSPLTFSVAGSLSGLQVRDYQVGGSAYFTDDEEVRLQIESGSTPFVVGDTFTFSTTAGTIVRESVTLTETGLDTGVFEGNISTVETATPVAGNGFLETVAGDRITAFYDDVQGDFGLPDQVRETALVAKTVIPGGTISADETWDDAGSPYLLTGDVTVADGVTLTITEGVQVYVLANSDDTDGGEVPYDTELIVRGTLDVQGTPGSEVLFTSSSRNPETNDWRGIRVAGGSADVDHAILEYGTYGIFGSGLQSNDEVTLSNSVIRYTGSQALKTNWGWQASVSVTDSLIVDNLGHGIYGANDYGRWTLSGNTITGNAGDGVQLHEPHSVSLLDNLISDNDYGVYMQSPHQGDLTVSGNVVSDNRSYGLYVHRPQSSSLTFTDNTLSENRSTSIFLYFETAVSPTLTGNTISGGQGYGIYLQNTRNNVSPEIRDNLISDHRYHGLYTYGKITPEVIGNTITGNNTDNSSSRGGAYFAYTDANGDGSFDLLSNDVTGNNGYGLYFASYAEPTVRFNDIYDNTGYQIENRTPHEINARSNYWGSAIRWVMEAGPNPQDLDAIYDVYDDPTRGFVNYSAWLPATALDPEHPPSPPTVITGTLSLLDADGNVTQTYETGELVRLRVEDPGANADAGMAESLTVQVTSDTENTGAPFTASMPVAGSFNVGDGTLSILEVGFSAQTEDWTLTATNASPLTFRVEGSVSGVQRRSYQVTSGDYVSDNEEIRLRIESGSTPFDVGDTFTFSTTAGTIVGESVTLIETGLDTGVFEGSLPLFETTSPVAGNGLLEILSGDLVTAFYDDAAGDFGHPTQVRQTALYAATVINGGTITADETWDDAGSPYLLTGDVTVAEGVTLTITEGVQVYVLANSDDTDGGEVPYDTELIVRGTLDVQGAPGSEVLFTSSSRNPETNDWRGIRVAGGCADVDHAILEYGTYGIFGSGLQSNDEVTLSNSVVRYTGSYAVHTDYGWQSSVSITDSQVVDNFGAGIYGGSNGRDYVHWTLSGNTIARNVSDGVRLQRPYSVSLVDNLITDNAYGVYMYSPSEGDLNVSGNVVSDNRSCGLYAYHPVSSSLTITDNTINNNGQSSVHLDYSTAVAPTLTGNTISGGQGYGIYLRNTNHDVSPEIRDNVISDHRYHGLYTYGKITPEVIGNTITGNNTDNSSKYGGAYFAYTDANGDGRFELLSNEITGNNGYGLYFASHAEPTVRFNDIYDNTGYQIENRTPHEINARSNYWGSAIRWVMEAGPNPQDLDAIYDVYDDPTRGFVNYSAWLPTTALDPEHPPSPPTVITGTLSLLDADGNVTQTYEAGELVRLRVEDPGANADAGMAESLTVQVTSDTENTGAPFTASMPVAGSSNVGDGTLSILEVGFSAQTEDWTLTATNASPLTFRVEGSVSGVQRRSYQVTSGDYVSDNEEIRLRIESGSTPFDVGDTFTFSTTAGTIVGESVTLIETGLDTGVFEGSLPLFETASPVPGNGLLEILSGDLVTAFYEDAEGDFGHPAQVRQTALYAATVVNGGTITADETWDVTGSPYLLTGDVTVADGVTLTITEGVQVYVLANSDDTDGGEVPYDTELIVRGTLDVQGAPGSEVLFTSSSRNPETNDWRGIRVQSGNANVDHAILEYGNYGIFGSNLQSNEAVSLSNCVVRYTGSYAVHTDYGWQSSVSITDSQVVDNFGAGIYGGSNGRDYVHWTLSGNTIARNVSDGVRLQRPYSVSLVDNLITDNAYGVYMYSPSEGDLNVSGNVVSDNRSCGLYAYHPVSSSLTITDNTINNNGQSSVHLDYSTAVAPTLTGNTISGGQGYGIYLRNTNHDVSPEIRDNLISDHRYHGLYTYGKITPEVIGNTITGNNTDNSSKYGGAYFAYTDANGDGSFDLLSNDVTGNNGYGLYFASYAEPTLNLNNLYDNTGYQIENRTAHEINARDNYWGEAVTAIMDAGGNPKDLDAIYDVYDDPTRGFVNYSAWLNAETAIVPQVIFYVDDGDPGYSTVGGWVSLASEDGYQNDYEYKDGGDGTAEANWEIRRLNPGNYRLYITWPADAARPDEVPITILDGGVEVDTVLVNQQVPPNDLSADGAAWEQLGVDFTLTSTTLGVRLTDADVGEVAADGIRLAWLGGPALDAEIEVFDGATELTDGVSTVDFGTAIAGNPVTRSFTVTNVGDGILSLRDPISLPTGFSVISTFDEDRLVPQESTTFTIQMDASAAGTPIGTVSFFNSDDDESPFDFQVTGEVIALSDLYGRVFEDRNADFANTPNEDGLSGWTVYIDEDDSGTLDEGETSLVTDTAGRYGFEDLLPGDYSIRVVQQEHWYPTSPPGGVYTVTLDSGEILARLDFGQYQFGSIQGYKFLDVNGDGDDEGGGDPRLADVTIVLEGIAVGNQPIGPFTSTTNAVGEYAFDNLPPADYTLSEVLPAGMGSTTGLPLELTLESGDELLDVAIGNAVLCSVDGLKFEDLNGNGQLDEGEPGLPDWTIFLDENDNGLLDEGEASTVTLDDDDATPDVNEAGTYRFEDVLPGTYRVHEELPSDWLQRHPVAVTGHHYHEITLESGDTVWDRNFGNVLAAAYVPELEVSYDGAVVDVGDQVNLGESTYGTPLTATFTVRNRGVAHVTLDAASLASSLAGSAEFSLASSFAATTLTANDGVEGGTDETTFVLQFDAPDLASFSTGVSFNNNDADENPFEFTVDVEATAPKLIVDDFDPEFHVSGFTAFAQGFRGQLQATGGDDSGDFATWNFSNLPDGLYRVSATWTPAPNRAQDAPYSLSDGRTVTINQELSPDDLEDEGAYWEDLVPYARITDGSLTVTLSDHADDTVIADAVRVEMVTPIFADRPEMELIDDNLRIEEGDQVDFGVSAVPVIRDFTIRNEGGAHLHLGAVSSSSTDFLVSGGSTMVAPGDETTITVEMTANVAGAVGSTISIVNNDNDENPFAFEVTGDVFEFTSQIIDNGDAEFSSSGFTIWHHGYLGDLHFTAGDGSGDWARWNFEGLPTGLYQVSATWSGGPDRATDSTFTFEDGPTPRGVANVNQQLAPDDFSDQNANWEILSPYVKVASGTLGVELNDQANGLLDADAVRIELLTRLSSTEPEIQVLESGMLLEVNDQLDFGASADPVVRTLTIRNEGSVALELGAATSSSTEFTVSGGNVTVRPDEQTTLTVTMNTSTTGDVSGTITVPNNDADEAPFVFGVSGTVTYPEITVFADDMELVDGAALMEFGVTHSGIPVSKTFTVRNLGTTGLTLDADSLGDSLAAISGFDLSGNLGSTTLAANDNNPGGVDETTFTIVLEAIQAGTFSGGVSFANNDADENPFDFEIAGEVLAPEIALSVQETDVPNVSGWIDFGSTLQGTPVATTITVQNLGTADLTLDSSSLESSLATIAEFSLVENFLNTTLTADDGQPNGADETTFVVRFDAATAGSFGGSIAFVNNDDDENPFTFGVSGDSVSPITIVDDGDDDFSSSGFTAYPVGYQGDLHYSTGDSTGDVASWTFHNLLSGLYRVSATWSGNDHRATDAPFTMRDGSQVLDVVSVDQQQAPDDFSDQGAQWEDLGPYFKVENGTLVVELSDAASDGLVDADAVRIELLTRISATDPEMQVLNGNQPVELGDALDLGSMLAPLNQQFTIRNEGGGDLNLGTLTSSSPEFTVTVDDTTLAAGEETTLTVNSIAGARGTLTTTISVANDDDDESPFTFDVNAELVEFGTTIIDNGDPGFSHSGFSYWGHGYQSDLHYAAGDNSGDVASWTLSGLPPALYRVSATWSANGDRASDTPFTVKDGDTVLITNLIDQRQAPDDFSDQGAEWEDLGPYFRIESGTLVVETSDNANGLVDADAIRLELLSTISTSEPEIQVFSEGQGLSIGDTLDLGDAVGPISRDVVVRNEGDVALNLLGISSSAPEVTITPGAAVVQPGEQTILSLALTGDGPISSTITINNDDSDEGTFTFMVIGTIDSSQIIDDSDSQGFVQTGFTKYFGQGFQGAVYAKAGANQNHSATWTFDELETGAYRVSATWSPYGNRATNAAYSINGGDVIAINQQLDPSDLASTPVNSVVEDFNTGVYFADLSLAATPNDGTITVQLSDANANGWIIADAIRIERLAALHAASPATDPLTVTPALSDADLEPLVTTAIKYWSGIDPAAGEQLRDVQLLVTDLPSSILGLASLASRTIWLDADGAGHGWHIDEQLSPTTDRMDLLSVITHELGHVLGQSDLDAALHSDNVMAGLLAGGHCPTLLAGPVDNVLSLSSDGNQVLVDAVFAEWPEEEECLDEQPLLL